MNFKEYLAWSRLAYGFEYMTTAGLPARTAVLRTAQAFRDMGLRFSKFNQRHTLAGISKVVDQRNYNYIEALKIAI